MTDQRRLLLRVELIDTDSIQANPLQSLELNDQ